MVSLFKGYDAGYQGLIPPYIVLTEPQGRFSEAGFLGVALQALRHRRRPGPERRSPSKASSPRASPTSGSSDRRELLAQARHARTTSCAGDPQLAAADQCEKQAYDLILGDAGKVFDLAQEKDDLRDRYGRNTFGQSCLLARRLVERGVPYITINYKGWDTHKQHFPAMRQKLPEMDKGMATLLQDLADRGLLGEHDRLVERRVRPHAQGPVGAALERRARPLGPGLLGAWWPAADSRAARSSGPRTPRARRSRSRPVYPCDLHRQHVRAAGHRPRRQAAASPGPRRPRLRPRPPTA